jgi:hypothetical protein
LVEATDFDFSRAASGFFAEDAFAEDAFVLLCFARTDLVAAGLAVESSRARVLPARAGTAGAATLRLGGLDVAAREDTVFLAD